MKIHIKGPGLFHGCIVCKLRKQFFTFEFPKKMFLLEITDSCSLKKMVSENILTQAQYFLMLIESNTDNKLTFWILPSFDGNVALYTSGGKKREVP